MTNEGNIEDKISVIRDYFNDLKPYELRAREQIENNFESLKTVERLLFQVCQSAIDLAEAFISLKKYRKPTTMKEPFEILEEGGIIDKDLSNNLCKMVGFRNVLVHEYLKIDYDRLFNVLYRDLADIEKFIKMVEKSL